KQDFKKEDVMAVGGVPLAGDSLDGSIMRRKVVKHFGGDVQYQVPFGDNVLKMPLALMSHLCSTAHIQLLNSRENRDFLSRVKSWSLGDEDQHRMEQLEILLDQQLGFAVFESIERAKRGLSESSESKIHYEYPGIRIDETFTRSEFETVSKQEVDKIFAALDATLLRAGVLPSQVSKVCLTGGTAKATVIRSELESRFGKEKLEEFRNFTSIAEGLAEYAFEAYSS
ncbi:MAG: Hsp70 family protein, partial [Proteobacteria bacterium]